MGVTFGVMCLECGVAAPEVGDFGYIGYPSLAEDKGSRYIPNFGYIYRGLVTLGLQTQAVEELCAFLLVHQDHQMEMSCEGEPMFGEDDEDEDADAPAYDEEDDDDDDAEEGEADEDADGGDEDDEDAESEDTEEVEDDDDEEGEDDSPLRVNPRRFVAAHYEASCPRCGETMRSKTDDRVLRFKAKALTKAEVRNALRRVTVDESFERASEPFGPEDFGSICRFLREHAAHRPKVALVAKA